MLATMRLRLLVPIVVGALALGLGPAAQAWRMPETLQEAGILPKIGIERKQG